MMISEITIKVTLGSPTAALAESSGGYARAEATLNPPDAVEEARGRFADIPVPELEETGSESGEIAPPESRSVFEEKATISSINKIRIMDDTRRLNRFIILFK